MRVPIKYILWYSTNVGTLKMISSHNEHVPHSAIATVALYCVVI